MNRPNRLFGRMRINASEQRQCAPVRTRFVRVVSGANYRNCCCMTLTVHIVDLELSAMVLPFVSARCLEKRRAFAVSRIARFVTPHYKDGKRYKRIKKYITSRVYLSRIAHCISQTYNAHLPFSLSRNILGACCRRYRSNVAKKFAGDVMRNGRVNDVFIGAYIFVVIRRRINTSHTLNLLFSKS